MKTPLIIALAACCAASPALAQNEEVRQAAAADTSIIRPGDSTMSCPQIVATAQDLLRVLGPSDSGGNGVEMLGTAANVAVQGAILTGAAAASIAPGVGLVSELLTGPARREREQRAAEERLALQRWYYLNGLYEGRECQAPAAAQTGAVTPPAPTPAPAGG
ncbi:MAG TPA: hypothetical protein VGB49_00235 [Caulobacteraceae bacterium]